jgi:hypothetical protein
MTEHKPMPVSGYSPQSDANVQLANEGKRLEELYLRWLDKLAADPNTDKRNVALAKTYMEDAAMRAVRSIFQPKRINLPDDTTVAHP